jgi:DNA polymerase III sliding clamp (beta) subunit (PCNA family)
VTPKALLDLLAMPLGIAARSSPINALTMLHIEDQVVTATDLNTSVQMDLNNCDALLDGVHGCVSAKRLQLALSTVHPSKELSITQSGQTLTLRCDGARRTLPMLPADQFPMPIWGTATVPCADPAALAAGLTFTKHAAATHDPARPHMQAVASDKGNLYATDGHRGARFDGVAAAASLRPGVLLPVAILERLIELARSAAGSEDDQLYCGTVDADDGRPRAYIVSTGRCTLQFQLVDGVLMPFERALPRQHNNAAQMSVHRETFAMACRGLQRIGTDGKKPAGLVLTLADTANGATSMSDAQLRLELAMGQSAGEEAVTTVACRQIGMTEWKQAYNAGYLADALEALAGQYVTVSPVRMAAGEVLYLTGDIAAQGCCVMPLKL